MEKIHFDNSHQHDKLPPTLAGVVAQLVERLNGIQEVRGSNPLGSTIRPERFSGEKLQFS